jgi:hypothetical protein
MKAWAGVPRALATGNLVAVLAGFMISSFMATGNLVAVFAGFMATGNPGRVYGARGALSLGGTLKPPLAAMPEPGRPILPAGRHLLKSGIVTVNEWRLYQSANVDQEKKDLRPGDSRPVTQHPARYNNTHIPIADIKEYQRRRNRRPPRPLFERYGKRGIKAVHTAMQQDKLR